MRMRSRYLVIPPILLGRFGSNLLFGTSCHVSNTQPPSDSCHACTYKYYLRCNVPYVFIMFDGVYGQCKPGINVTAHISLETEHYLAENFIFDDRQYGLHARRRC